MLRGDLSLEGSKQRKALQLATSYGRHNVSFSASLNTLDKVRTAENAGTIALTWDILSYGFAHPVLLGLCYRKYLPKEET